MLKAKILGFEVVYAKNFTSLDGNALKRDRIYLRIKYIYYLSYRIWAQQSYRVLLMDNCRAHILLEK